MDAAEALIVSNLFLDYWIFVSTKPLDISYILEEAINSRTPPYGSCQGGRLRDAT